MTSSHDGLSFRPPPSPTPSSVLSAPSQRLPSPYSGLPPPSPSTSIVASRPPLPHRTARNRHSVTPSRRFRRKPPRNSLYIPPFRQQRIDALRQTPVAITDEEGQKRAWVSMKKTINGVINKINTDNIYHCIIQLFRVNLVRGRGIFSKSLLRAQFACPSMSPIFACLVAVVGSRFPAITELFIHRLVTQLKAAKENQDRTLCFATARFIAHLVNQRVIDELLVLEFLTDCMMEPSDNSIEMATTTLQDCGPTLSDRAPRAFDSIFQGLREILHEGELSKRVQTMVEKTMQLRRSNFSSTPVIDEKLDLLDKEDTITHSVSLKDDSDMNNDYACNEFQYDPEYEENEREYDEIRKDILGVNATDKSHFTQNQASDDAPTDDGQRPNTNEPSSSDGKQEKISDMTDADLVEIRRAIYLTHVSTLSYEEGAHKLMRLMSKHPGKEDELCKMIVESCSHEKSYLRSYGLLGQRLCMLSPEYKKHFEKLFAEHYASVHRFDLRKIRNMACFYASLLSNKNVLPWDIFHVVCIEEKVTTSSSRIFLKDLFQEIAKTLGERQMKEIVKKAEKAGHLDGVFPSDNAKNMRFAINFFVQIELGFLTDDLREKLKSLPASQANDDSSESDSSSNDSADSSSSLSSSSLSSSSDEDDMDRDQSNEDGNSSRRASGSRPRDIGGPSDEPKRSSVGNEQINMTTNRDGNNENRSGDGGDRDYVNRTGQVYEEIERNNRAFLESPRRVTAERSQLDLGPEEVRVNTSRATERPKEPQGEYHSRRDRREYPKGSGDNREITGERRYERDDSRPRRRYDRESELRNRNRYKSRDREGSPRNSRRHSRRSHSSEEYTSDEDERRRHRSGRERGSRNNSESQSPEDSRRRHRSRRDDDRYRSVSPDRSHRRRGSDRERRLGHRSRRDRRDSLDSEYSPDHHRSSDRRHRSHRRPRSGRYHKSRGDRSDSEYERRERSRSPEDRKRFRAS